MEISGISASFPSRCVSNEEVINKIREGSCNSFEGDLNEAANLVEKLLIKSGSVHRRWCDKNEHAIDHLAQAVDQALGQANLKAEEVDLLIYVGIGRGFLEPGNGYMVAQSLGINRAECFDITDACMSWVRALAVVNSLFKEDRYRNALIINAEFNMLEGGPLNPGNFVLSNMEQLRYTLPSYTIGEAATATVLVPSAPDNFHFTFRSRPDLAGLCTIPMAGWEHFVYPTSEVGKNGDFRFTSFGHELHAHGGHEVQLTLDKLGVAKNELDIVFTHASSSTAWAGYGEKAGIAEKIYHIYPETGNLVSASVPAAMSLAIKASKLKRGDSVLFWVGSADMSFNATHFKF